MSTELVNLQEIVRDQIRETVMKAVPAETIDKIVRDFFNGEFKNFVISELKIQIEKKFKEDIHQQASGLYNSYGKQKLGDISNEVAKSIMDGFQQSILNTVMNQLRNSTYQSY